MSFIVNKENLCTHCQFPNDVEVWSIINVKEDPELKDILLGGELNMIECISCKKVFYAENFLLYHDPAIHLMAFVYTFADQENRAQFEEKTRLQFDEYQVANAVTGILGYGPITLFGLDQLLELVEWDDAAHIQAEIASHLLKEKGFEFKKCKPSFYRQHRLPPLLPFKKESAPINDGALLKAIHEIIELNDRLSIYKEAEIYLTAHPQLVLELMDSKS